VSDDRDRAAILARRKRWIGLALAGVATATQATSCACLAPVTDSGRFYDGGPDAGNDAATHPSADGGTTDDADAP
jgi:hypothetical protein